MRFEVDCSIGVDRPVKVENTCLLKAPVLMTFGLPPATQMPFRTALSFASVKAAWVPSVRVPVPLAAAGSEPPVPLEVFDLIQERTEARLRAVASAPAFF